MDTSLSENGDELCVAQHPSPPLYLPVRAPVATVASVYGGWSYERLGSRLVGPALRQGWGGERGSENGMIPGSQDQDVQGCLEGRRGGRRREGRWRGMRRTAITPKEGIAGGGERGWRVPELRSWEHLGGRARGMGRRRKAEMPAAKRRENESRDPLAEPGGRRQSETGSRSLDEGASNALGLVALASSSPPPSGFWFPNPSEGDGPHPALPWKAATSVRPSSVWRGSS